LKTGTYNAASALNQLDSSGTIEIGKIADLVLLKSNPLENIKASRSHAGVMSRGTWFSRSELDSLLEGLALTYKQ